MLRSKRNYFGLLLFHVNLLFSKMVPLFFFEKTHSALNPTRVGILSSKPCCDVALHPSASWEESTMGWNVFVKSSISRDIYDDLYY